MFQAWSKKAMHKRRHSFGSKAIFVSLEEEENFLEGDVFPNQGLIEEVCSMKYETH